jgi:hypothetical protein
VSDETDQPVAADDEEPATDDLAAPDAGAGRGARGGLRVAVIVLAVLIVGGAVAAWLLSDDRPGLTGPAAADALIEAYTRNLDATFVVEGELTRTLDDGRTLSSAYLTVQRPPDHLQRSLGSTSGDLNGRTVNCSTPPGGEYTCAASGEAVPWDEQRATILGALDSYVRGDDPVYDVSVDDADCFVLVRRRTELDATYGRGARLCFDPTYAALRRLEVQRDGGATDVMLAARISDQVTDADFDLQGDSTYDPQVPDDAGTVPPTSA